MRICAIFRNMERNVKRRKMNVGNIFAVTLSSMNLLIPFLMPEISILTFSTETNINNFIQHISTNNGLSASFMLSVSRIHPAIYQWQESHAEIYRSYFSLNYSGITLLRREWHLFYNLLSLGFSSCIRMNETILYHSAVVITPNFDICCIWLEVPPCHQVCTWNCIWAHVSACVWTCKQSHLDICFLLTESQAYVWDWASLPFWHIFFLWLDALRNTTMTLKTRGGVWICKHQPQLRQGPLHPLISICWNPNPPNWIHFHLLHGTFQIITEGKKHFP